MPPTNYPLTTDTEIWDAFKATQSDVLEFTGGPQILAQQHQDYHFAKLLADSNRHYPVGSHDFKWDLMHDVGTGMKFVPFDAPDTTDDNQTNVIASETLVHATWNISWIRQDVLRNAKAKGGRFFDYIKSIQTASDMAVLDSGEERTWGAGPTSSAEAATYPKSIPWWIQKRAAGTAGRGFDGGDPSGFEAIGRGHVLTSTYDKWANYNAHYAAYSDEDLLDEIRLMEMNIKFKKPVKLNNGYDTSSLPNPTFYTTQNMIIQLRRLMRANRDNIFDLSGPTPIYNGKSMVWVPYLDADTTDPIYAIDVSDCKLAYLEGDFLHETKFEALQGQHNARAQFWDLTFQIFFTNLRKHGVINHDATAA